MFANVVCVTSVAGVGSMAALSCSAVQLVRRHTCRYEFTEHVTVLIHTYWAEANWV